MCFIFSSFVLCNLQVVRYLRENLTEKNVLLVLQHICLYCSSASAGRSTCQDWSNLDETSLPITVGPTKKCRSMSVCYDSGVAGTAAVSATSGASGNTTAIAIASAASTNGNFFIYLLPSLHCLLEQGNKFDQHISDPVSTAEIVKNI